MAAPGKKKEKKKPLVVKTSLNNPYDLKWTALEKGQARFILKTVTERLEELGLRKENAKAFRKWGEKKKCTKKDSGSTRLDAEEPTQFELVQTGSEEPTQLDTTQPSEPNGTKTEESVRLDAEEPTQCDLVQPGSKEPTQLDTTQPSEPCRTEPEESVRRGWSRVALRRQLAVGVNEVTKALERNQLSLLLVCESAQPAHVVAHLIPLSRGRGVPACRLRGLSAALSAALGLGSVLALGFRRSADAFSATVAALIPALPPLDVAWAPGPTPQPPAEPEPGEPASRKRKLPGYPGSSEPQSSGLQPLRVKKIIPNPSKIRKAKKSKAKHK